MGIDNYLVKEKKEHTLHKDKMWNLQYFRNIDGHHASLNYAHYTFRKVEGMNRHVGYSRAALSGNYKNVSSLVFPSFICSKQRDVTIHFQSQIV